MYDLTEQQRLEYAHRAARGDIIAAKRLVEYHEMVTKDVDQYHYWLKIVNHLQNSQRNSR